MPPRNKNQDSDDLVAALDDDAPKAPAEAVKPKASEAKPEASEAKPAKAEVPKILAEQDARVKAIAKAEAAHKKRKER